jgi:uncharacterized protein (DUF1015 family)
MAVIRPFRALRPYPPDAARVAAVPYDVVSTEEARVLAADNPLSFLRVSRPELELAPGVDPHSDEVYDRAVQNFKNLRARAMLVEDQPSIYVYRLRRGTHEQTGLAACFSLDEYDRDVIKKHERTRRDKEDDRTRHMIVLRAQTGPVFLTYYKSNAIDSLVARETDAAPLYDFDAVDGVRHTVWQVSVPGRLALIGAFEQVSCLYIADGHHRAASAARARAEIGAAGFGPLPGDADASTFVAVAFPHDQVKILPYNRAVRDLAGLDPAAFKRALDNRFEAFAGPAAPDKPGDIAMYFGGTWTTLRARSRPDPSDAIGSLDVSVLQDQLLAPVLRIADLRTDTRIEFIGGARGTAELEQRVDSGSAAVAFSLHPVRVEQLMAVSDAGAIMPPKSTWFEPKLRDGLLSHLI